MISNTETRAAGFFPSDSFAILIKERLPIRIAHCFNLFPQGRTGFGAYRIFSSSQYLMTLA